MKEFMAVIRSVLAGFIGVQSEKNRERDFQSETHWPFVIVGIIATLLFMALMIFLANLALKVMI